MSTRIYYNTPGGYPPNGAIPPAQGRPLTPPPLYEPPPTISFLPQPHQVPNMAVPRPDYGCVPLDLPAWLPLQPVPPGYFPTAPPGPPPPPYAVAATPLGPPPPAPPPSEGSQPNEPRRRGAALGGHTVTFNDGIGYLFPPKEKHTILHVVSNEHRLWEAPGKRFGFSTFRVPTLMTLKELVEQLSPPGDINPAWGITECLEVGNGTWREGSSFSLGGNKDKLTQTLGSLGWNESRGTTNKPVWIVLHKFSTPAPG
ncbi:hypothetical protein MMC24_001982 [Lignoscripta atroalba]|nr:hypothetical protein [Lignoscripta atroalba]